MFEVCASFEVATQEHEAIGRAVGSLQIDHLVALGEDAAAMAIAARDPHAVTAARELLSQIELSKTRADMPDEEAATHMLLGAALTRDGKLPEAKAHLEKAVTMRAAMDAPDSPMLAEARLYLAQHRNRAAARDEARALVDSAARALKAQQTGPQFHRLLAETRGGTLQRT